MNKTMQFGKKEDINGLTVLSYISYLREDFVDRYIKIFINKDDTVQEIFFSSNDFSTTYWENGRGLLNSHQWEDEDSAQEISSLSRHYTTLLINGEVSIDYAKDKIVEDVIKHLPDQNLAERIGTIIKTNSKNPVIEIP